VTDPMRQVYLVDDDPAVAKAISRLLRSAGYEPITFTSAKAFMQGYSPEARGCLVLDISMPGITGLELQEWLVQSDSALPVIFLTGHSDISTRLRAIEKGAVDFLTKPVLAATLFKAVDEGLRREREARPARAARCEAIARQVS
jgi:FixJ family two-component response regulator